MYIDNPVCNVTCFENLYYKCCFSHITHVTQVKSFITQLNTFLYLLMSIALYMDLF